jgi:Rieske Fe-S protein
VSDTTSAAESAAALSADGAASRVKRRAVMQGAALTGVGIALAACGSNSDEPTPVATDNSPAPSDAPQDSPSKSEPTALTDTSAVPVDGGVIVDQEVVVTQPEKGTFKGFSAICTHQGCVVNNVADGVISCPCHGSQYSVVDGSVLEGPAPSPLPAVEVTVKNGQVFRA